MAERPTDPLVRYIRRLAEVQQNNLLSDQELLRRFAVNQDQAAFTALVRRHGPMVLRVCRRVLRHGPEAEDVFQATFMVLSRKAGSRHWQESIGKWLYKVAHHLALEAKANLLRRQARESQVDVHQVVDPHSATSLHDAETVLDEELERLPESLRLPLVLCCLEGQTHGQAAQQLGCSEKTIGRRISQARELLRMRLERRGVALSTALLMAGLANEALAAEMPALLVGPTVRAAVAFAARQGGLKTGISTPAAALAEGVLQAMVLTKVKLGAVLLMATLLVGTAGALVCQRLVGLASGQAAPAGRPARTKSLALSEPKKATADLYGDPLPAKAVFRLGTVRFRHPELTSLAFTKDGRFLVSGGEDRVVRVWPVKNGQITAALREFVNVDAFALDGADQLVIVTHDKDFFDSSEKKEFQPTITVYDVASGKQIKAFQPKFPCIEALCGSPDGKVVYALTHDRTKDIELIQALDLQTEKVLRSSSIKITRSTIGMEDELVSRDGNKTKLLLWVKAHWHVVLDPDHQLVAETRGAEDVHVWNMATKTTDTIKAEKSNQGGFPTKLGFSPIGARLAIAHCRQEQVVQASGKNIIEVWDAKAKKPCFSIKNRSTACFAFSPDGKELATAASEQASEAKKPDSIPIIQLWDATTGKEMRTLQGSGDDALRALAYSPDGKLLASGSTDGVIRLWDRQSGLEASPSVPLAEPITSLSSTADGNQLLTAGVPGHLHWWDVAAGRITRTLRHAPLKYAGLDISADGKRVAAAGLKPGVAPTRSALLYLSGSNKYEAVVLEANGREVRWVRDIDSPCVKLCRSGQQLLCVKGKAICCLDLDTGKEVFKLTGKDVGVKWFALSPDESFIAAEANDHFLCVWDVPTRRLLHTEGLADWASAAVDPKRGGDNACLKIDCALRSIVNVGSNSKASTCNEWVRALAFAPDGRTMAFRVEFYRRSLEFGPPNDPLGLLNKKPKLLSKVYLMDLRTFQSRALDEDFDFHTSLAFAPDGRTLAAAGVDGSSIHLYEVATYKERAAFHGHQGSIWDLQFAPDNHRLYSVSEDATALVWDFIGTPRSVSSADTVSARWANLAGDDAAKAYRAIHDLATVPDKVLPLLRRSLTPAVAVDLQWMKQLVAELNSDDFKKRAHAHAELEKLGEQAEPALAEAERAKPELDFKRRLKTLLASARRRFLVPLTGEALRSVRGVELLERIGSPEACDLLKKLAGGAPGFRLTHEAQSSLRRLEARAKP